MLDGLECLAPLGELVGVLLEIGVDVYKASAESAAALPPPRHQTVVDLGDITHRVAGR